MKICFLMVSHWTGDLGGAEVQVKYIMEYIQKYTEHEVFYICRKTKVSDENGIVIHKTNANRFLSRHFKAVDYFSIKKYLTEIKPDVIYTRVSTAFVGIAAKYCKQYNKKLIYHIAHINDVIPFKANRVNQLAKKIERGVYLYGLKNAHEIIGQAKYQDELLQKNYHRKCSAIIPNFHPTPDKDEISKNGKIKVLWIANIKEGKQPELYVELAKAFKNTPHIQFDMIGILQDKKYQNFANEVKEIPNFTYHGYLPLEKANNHLNTAHIFVNTSKIGGEGFPNTFIQAWMRKVAVVTLSVDPDEIIAKNELGFYSKTMSQLVKDVSNLIDNPRLREDIGIRAQIFAKQNFGVEKNCRKIVDLMEKPC